MHSNKLLKAKPKHIGIVGVTAEGAALCYKTIVAESAKILGEHRHPEITLHNASFHEILEKQNAGDWHGVAAILLDSVRKLVATGPEFAIIPANSIHFAIKDIQKHSPIPVLNLLEIVAKECENKRYRRVLVLGVGITMDDHLYDKTLRKHAVVAVYPNDEEKERINMIIYSELVKGICNDDSSSAILQIIESAKQNGADSVILACTELPLVISNANSPLPIIDTTRLLSLAALHAALSLSVTAEKKICYSIVA